MAIDLNSPDALRLRKLIPLATLPGTVFNALCNELTIEEIRDAYLFKKGDTDNQLIYLIEGEVALQAEGLVIDVVSSEDESSKFALAHQLPRKIDAVAKGLVRFIRLDAERANNPAPVEYKEDPPMVVVEEEFEEDEGDWMTSLLKLPIFQRLPPANLQKVLIALKEVGIGKGDVIIEQGTPGDYFYFLKSGQCVASRKPTPHSKDIRLGVLEKGDVFGEDSLITDAPRTVTVTALTDVTLLRLDKKQFVTLIKTPSIGFVTYQEMLDLQKEGAVVLDIRSPDEYQAHHVEGSINMPFYSLRMQHKSLSRDKTVIVLCRDGRISEAGAFFLLKIKYKALVLKDGMAAVPANSVQNSEAEDAETKALSNSVSTLAPNKQEAAEEQIRKLKAENEALVRAVKQLTEKCGRLELEKKQVEDRFAVLSKHFEQLKQMLQKLKNNA